MDSHPTSEHQPCIFFRLPLEIRYMIYERACDWNDAIRLYKQNRYRMRPSRIRKPTIRPRNCGFKGEEPPKPTTSTPSILLLSRQINEEARSVLSKCKFIIKSRDTTTSYRNPYGDLSGYSIFQFITPQTFRQIPLVQLQPTCKSFSSDWHSFLCALKLGGTPPKHLVLLLDRANSLVFLHRPRLTKSSPDLHLKSESIPERYADSILDILVHLSQMIRVSIEFSISPPETESIPLYPLGQQMVPAWKYGYGLSFWPGPSCIEA